MNFRNVAKTALLAMAVASPAFASEDFESNIIGTWECALQMGEGETASVILDYIENGKLIGVGDFGYQKGTIFPETLFLSLYIAGTWDIRGNQLIENIEFIKMLTVSAGGARVEGDALAALDAEFTTAMTEPASAVTLLSVDSRNLIHRDESDGEITNCLRLR